MHNILGVGQKIIVLNKLFSDGKISNEKHERGKCRETYSVKDAETAYFGLGKPYNLD